MATQYTILDEKVCILGCTKCSQIECETTGCGFPYCAIILARFDSLEEAQQKYSDLEEV